jgi:site-specific recombinase XerD
MTSPKNDAVDEARALLGEYEQFLLGKARGTADAYVRTARQLIGWLAQRPGHEGRFQPGQVTQTAVEQYLAYLKQEGFGLHHQARVKSSISTFANYLIEEKGLLQRNPTRAIELPPMPPPAPQPLSPRQRSLLRLLVRQAGDRRGAALFALGYWAGCRVSEISWLTMAQTHVGPQQGWLYIDHDGRKGREIDLLPQACKPLYAYLQATRGTPRIYVFVSQRSERLTEEGIYYWFRALKAQASSGQWEVIGELTFHNLRDDFAQRAREASWSLEEIAYYLGNVTREGLPAIQSVASTVQVSREQLKYKLYNIKG